MAKNMEMDDDIENVGIMQGFLDEMGDDMEEEENGDEENSAAKMLDRRPNSPEILMNNLRGDMRSIDARREELADLVGYAAAVETPDSVLAMLQPVLAQGGGLGALPESMPMAQGPQAPMPPPPGPMSGPPPGLPPVPPEAMMPPPSQDGGIAALLAAGAPGGGQAPPQAPIGMKDGGYVQRFSNGSDEEGVTQAEEDNSPSEMDVTPDMLALARAGYNRLLTQKLAPEVDLRTRASEREKLYQELLGDDKEMQQAQLLLMLGQKGLQLAGNVDAQGRPLRGSTLGRFATVASEVPGAISQFISEADKRQNAIRMAAIQAAEKDAELSRRSNLSTIESQRRAFGDVLKNARGSATGMFGKGGMGPFWATVFSPNLAQAYADGMTTPEQDNLFVTAANAVLASAQPKMEVYKDAFGNDVSRTVPGFDQGLDWLKEKLAQRQELDASGVRPPPATTGTVPVGPGTLSPDAAVVEPTVAQGPTPPAQATTQGPAGAETVGYDPNRRGIWQMTPNLGFLPVAGAAIGQNIPLAGGISVQAQQDVGYFETSLRELVKALSNNPRYAEGERQAIEAELELEPRVRRDEQALRNKIVGVNRFLSERLQESSKAAVNMSLPADARKLAATAANTIREFQAKLNIPRIVYSIEEAEALPSGTVYYFKNDVMTERVAK